MENHIWVFEAVSQGSCFKLCKLHMNEHVGSGLNGMFDMTYGITRRNCGIFFLQFSILLFKGLFLFRIDILLVLKYLYSLCLNRDKIW